MKCSLSLDLCALVSDFGLVSAIGAHYLAMSPTVWKPAGTEGNEVAG